MLSELGSLDTAIMLQVENGYPAYRIADWAGTSERMTPMSAGTSSTRYPTLDPFAGWVAERRATVPQLIRSARRGKLMSLVLVMAKLTPEAMQTWHAQGLAKRAAEVSDALESIGGSVVGYYAADGGEWDSVNIFRLPDDWGTAAMISFFQRSYGAGAHVRLQHIHLATAEEVDAATAPQIRSVANQ